MKDIFQEQAEKDGQKPGTPQETKSHRIYGVETDPANVVKASPSVKGGSQFRTGNQSKEEKV